MAHNFDESMALADVYAEALLKAAAERDEEEAIAHEMAEFMRFIEQEIDLCRMLAADSVDDDPRRQSIERIFRGRMSDLLVNLLQVMNNRGRLSLVRKVGRCVELRMEEKHHQQEVVVETAMPLSDDQKSAIHQEMSARIGREAILIEQVKPELIGGVVIRYSDMQIDASVTSRIRRTYRRIRERATEEIHGGRGYAVEA
ncbi:MAG: ATP synthase F1 subunit delta [Phycisphaerae bacterium]|jgi:F-type H+-transporting ATPase subunit delta|nr:ATP synthase F1 subunit delta [Phycisphaerae bacterium]